jgi:hypothetical protein
VPKRTDFVLTKNKKFHAVKVKNSSKFLKTDENSWNLFKILEFFSKFQIIPENSQKFQKNSLNSWKFSGDFNI